MTLSFHASSVPGMSCPLFARSGGMIIVSVYYRSLPSNEHFSAPRLQRWHGSAPLLLIMASSDESKRARLFAHLISSLQCCMSSVCATKTSPPRGLPILAGMSVGKHQSGRQRPRSGTSFLTRANSI